jgi:hypothetical protein
MKRISEHIILDYSKQPSEYVCEKCGARRQVHLPATVDDFVKQGEAFAESHKYCNPNKLHQADSK